MNFRPVDIARKLNVSTSALRNYEAAGLVPPAERTAAGHRTYTELHAAYFECIQAMSPGFGMDVTAEVLRLLQKGERSPALWCMTEAQAALFRDKRSADETLAYLESGEAESPPEEPESGGKSIGRVSAETGVPRSAIRYWEKEGLVSAARNPVNGYRTFTRHQVRKIRLIHTLRQAVYSQELAELKRAIGLLDPANLEAAKTIARDSLRYLERMNLHQLKGAYSVYKLCEKLDVPLSPSPRE
ncbi:MerR family DNA-binding transcriptional regulator [Paenibacillus sp. UNC499MF]|uniref:MerR family DNA-binding transcriptional regulator n=1 Tax=Paenibacillus sp. UNC499MF TaxID=1502751 RepID=UPI0008A05C1E|nr:MerR family DNA-binding transcriptional regulator [Paenibacillus sp. UNC499MF]SEG45567.1 DNA-binding transcriptional regulator, MerR family [Paenibacillus sp. UNC499MF]